MYTRYHPTPLHKSNNKRGPTVTADYAILQTPYQPMCSHLAQMLLKCCFH